MLKRSEETLLYISPLPQSVIFSNMAPQLLVGPNTIGISLAASSVMMACFGIVSFNTTIWEHLSDAAED